MEKVIFPTGFLIPIHDCIASFYIHFFIKEYLTARDMEDPDFNNRLRAESTALNLINHVESKKVIHTRVMMWIADRISVAQIPANRIIPRKIAQRLSGHNRG